MMEQQKQNDFEKVSEVINDGLMTVKKLKEIKTEELNEDAKLFLFSQLRKIAGVILAVLMYDQKRASQN